MTEKYELENIRLANSLLRATLRECRRHRERLLEVCRILLSKVETCRLCEGSGYEPDDDQSACGNCGGIGETCFFAAEIHDLRDVTEEV